MAKHETIPATRHKLVHDLSFKPKKRHELFMALAPSEQADIIHMLNKNVKRDVLTHMNDDDLVALLAKVDPDEATDLLQLLGPKKREQIVERLSTDLKETLGRLLEFDPNTAAGLMTLDYTQVTPTNTVSEVAQKLKLHEDRTGRTPIVLAVEDGRLLGVLPSNKLVIGKPTEHIYKYIKRTPTINYSATYKEVIDSFRSHPHDKVVVLNDDGSVLGIIYSDDVLQLMHEQESASLYDFAGINAEESVLDNARRKVKFRYKWLIINLGTAFLAAFTVGQFEETISKYVLLAVYMPIVAGMGGNAATQTLAVMVRGISLRQITLRTAFRTLRNEVGAGIANGLINGFLVAFIVLVKDNDPKIAFILAVAMVINLIVAASFGTIVPLIMSKLKKDPASSATIFITTATDVLGFLAFLGLATLVLE